MCMLGVMELQKMHREANVSFDCLNQCNQNASTVVEESFKIKYGSDYLKYKITVELLLLICS